MFHYLSYFFIVHCKSRFVPSMCPELSSYTIIPFTLLCSAKQLNYMRLFSNIYAYLNKYAKRTLAYSLTMAYSTIYWFSNLICAKQKLSLMRNCRVIIDNVLFARLSSRTSMCNDLFGALIQQHDFKY